MKVTVRITSIAATACIAAFIFLVPSKVAFADEFLTELADAISDEQQEWCTDHPNFSNSDQDKAQGEGGGKGDGYKVISGGVDDNKKWFISVIENQYASWRVALGFLFASCPLTDEEIASAAEMCGGRATLEEQLICASGEAQAAGGGSCKDSALCFFKIMEKLAPGTATKRGGEASDKKGHAFIEVNKDGRTFFVDPVNSIILEKQ